jgi:hypothetical protein
MTLFVLAVLSILGLSFVRLLARHIGSGSEILPVTTEWLGSLSDDQYRPMLRLLEESDFRFLRTQKGYTPALENRLRCRRMESFLEYLNMLESDFKRVCLALKVVMVQSESDRPDLASALIHRQLTFAFCMLLIQFRLILFRCGIAGVDATGIVNLFDGMRLELKTLLPVTSAVTA